jgi:glycosyltransferase involved in cell wall biosynthesis
MCVARIDKVKRQLDLVDAFERSSLAGWKLVLVGACDGRDGYTTRLLERAARNPSVVLAGFRGGRALAELYSHCAVFVLPSSLEGHPIALLEALTYGVPVLASDIPENRALPIPSTSFFPVGDSESLARLLAEAAVWKAGGGDLSRIVKERFSWRRAAHLTRSVYDRVLARRA